MRYIRDLRHLISKDEKTIKTVNCTGMRGERSGKRIFHPVFCAVIAAAGRQITADKFVP